MLCVCVYSSNGLIEAVGPADSIESHFREAVFDKVLDATGMCVLPGKYSFCRYLLCIFQMTTILTHLIFLPGLVDAHTHPVWAGDRVHEFAMKVN